MVRKKNDYSGKVMAMKVMNKQDMISRNYVNHTLQEKDIMSKVISQPKATKITSKKKKRITFLQKQDSRTSIYS